MTLQKKLKSLVLIPVLALFACGQEEAAVEQVVETGPVKTNVILIMADDIGVEAFGSYGGESWSTPEIDQMAAEGMQFMNAHSQPLCTPTRVKIMTGQDNWRNYTRFAYMDASLKTFGNMAKEAGYNTMVSGKWLRMPPDAISYPLQTMSYCMASIVNGS